MHRDLNNFKSLPVTSRFDLNLFSCHDLWSCFKPFFSICINHIFENQNHYFGTHGI